jgi:hypothetical protein
MDRATSDRPKDNHQLIETLSRGVSFMIFLSVVMRIWEFPSTMIIVYLNSTTILNPNKSSASSMPLLVLCPILVEKRLRICPEES